VRTLHARLEVRPRRLDLVRLEAPAHGVERLQALTGDYEHDPLLTVDVAALRKNLQAAADRAREAAIAVQAQVARISPYVAAFARTLIERPNAVKRYVGA